MPALRTFLNKHLLDGSKNTNFYLIKLIIMILAGQLLFQAIQLLLEQEEIMINVLMPVQPTFINIMVASGHLNRKYMQKSHMQVHVLALQYQYLAIQQLLVHIMKIQKVPHTYLKKQPMVGKKKPNYYPMI